MKPKTITVLITTYNWKEALELVLLNMFKQSVLPDEIVIADDGSRLDTKETIDHLRELSLVPLVHIRQEDKGFRLAKIRNKGIIAATSEYIIQIDGDCVPHRHFIKDHLELAEKGYCVCGSRMYCTKNFSERWQKTKIFDSLRFVPIKGSLLNGLRIKWLRKRLVNYNVTIKGSNMAYWRDDLIAVNGYDEYYEGWGFEDTDLVARLNNFGVKRRTLKMGGLMFHLYHKETERPPTVECKKRIQKIAYIQSHKEIVWAENGLDKYL